MKLPDVLQTGLKEDKDIDEIQTKKLNEKDGYVTWWWKCCLVDMLLITYTEQ